MALARPSLRWALLFIFALGLVGFAIDSALMPPHFGVPFKPGSSVESRQGRVHLQENDLVTDPTKIQSYSDLNSFYEKQKLLFLVTYDPTIKVSQAGHSEVITPRKKTILDLSPWFWVQIAAGLAALALAGRFWSLRPYDVTAGYFNLAGAATFVSLVTSAVYTTRELALPALQLQILIQLNIISSALFGISLITLFLIHPLPLPSWKLLANIQSFIFSTWTALIIIQAVPERAHLGLVIAAQMVCVSVCVFMQFIMTPPATPARSRLLHLGGPIIVASAGLAYLQILNSVSFVVGYVFLFIMAIYAFNRWSKV